MLPVLTLVLGTSAASAQGVQADTAPTAEPVHALERVEVVGMGASLQMSGRKLQQARAAFAEHQTRAPSSSLRFRVRDGRAADAYRLGDLRVECAITVAMAWDEVPLLLRKATLQADGHPVSLSNDRRQWWPPLHDDVLPDDALISLEAR